MARGRRRLLERSDQVARLRRQARAAARAQGSVVLVEGGAGVGKTSLLRAAVAMAGASGLVALQAVAGILEGDLGWNRVRQLFGDVILAPEEERAGLLAGAAALAAGPLGLAPGRPPAQSLHGLYWLTARLAERSPLLIAVDDAHWGDEPSLRYLAYLGQRVADLPVALLVATRSGEARPQALDALAASAGAERMALPDLSPAASAELTRSELAGADDDFCAACHRVSGGNPFLLVELLAQLRRDGTAPSAEHAADVARTTPETVARTILLRLSRLPEPARQLASAAAVLGDPARLADAASLAGIALDDAARAADALAAEEILDPGEPLRFAHPLVRAVVYGELPAHERARMHRRAAAVLWENGAGAERVAPHLALTAPAGDRWAMERLREAARAALAAGAPSSAAELLGRALR